MPEARQKRLGHIRVSFLKRFKYGVYYKIYGYRVIIIAVLHNSRDPEIWQNR
jgi:plasmid stabilization system protein ParE